MSVIQSMTIGSGVLGGNLRRFEAVSARPWKMIPASLGRWVKARKGHHSGSTGHSLAGTCVRRNLRTGANETL